MNDGHNASLAMVLDACDKQGWQVEAAARVSVERGLDTAFVYIAKRKDGPFEDRPYLLGQGNSHGLGSHRYDLTLEEASEAFRSITEVGK